MSVRAGREFLAIPGPTTVPDEVLRAMHRPAVDIYAGPLLALTDSLLRDIARVFNTKGRAYIYISNGHGAWEASLTNVLSKGDKVLVLESGRFAIGWGESARRMGVEVEILKGDMRRAVRPAEVEARLKADKAKGGKTIKAILVAQIDTASGVVNDIEAIGQAIRAAGPRRAADGRRRRVARLHAVRDGQVGRRRRDVGLAEGHDDAAGPGLRRRQRPRARGPQDGRPAHALLGLDRPRGRSALPEIRRHAARAPAVRPAPGARHAVRGGARERVSAATGCWPRRCAARSACGREGQAIGFNIIEASERSNSVTCVLVNGHDPEAIRAYANQKCGVILGHGIGELSGKAFRVAHMGHVNAPMILGTLERDRDGARPRWRFRMPRAARRRRSTG